VESAVARRKGDVVCAAGSAAAASVVGATWGTLAADVRVAATTRVASAARALTALGKASMVAAGMSE
jgi:hypothetical protein